MTCKQCGGDLIKMKTRNRQKEPSADQDICLRCQLAKLGWVQE